MTVNLGDLRYYQNEDIEIGSKATGGGTALPPGTCVQYDQTAKVWIISALANPTWRHGVIPNLAPLNTDSDATLQVVTGSGAEIYVRGNGAIGKNSGVIGDDGGKVKQTAAGIPGFASFIGKEGQGMGGLDAPATDSADEEIICIKIGPGA